jgi:hypothetical protein
MDTTRYCGVVDRRDWPAGPWDAEPEDKVQWAATGTGVPCLAVRGVHGAWCGYVGVPPEHPAYGQAYTDVEVDVHGGLTYAGACQRGGNEARAICHVPGGADHDAVWWLGCDTCHAWDVAPRLCAFVHPCRDQAYRTLAYVQAECAALAAQLAILATEASS